MLFPIVCCNTPPLFSYLPLKISSNKKSHHTDIWVEYRGENHSQLQHRPIKELMRNMLTCVNQERQDYITNPFKKFSNSTYQVTMYILQTKTGWAALPHAFPPKRDPWEVGKPRTRY